MKQHSWKCKCFRKYKPLVIKKPSVCKHPEDHHNVLSEVILRDGTFNHSLLTWYVWFMYLAYNQKGTTKYHHYQTNDGYVSLQVLIQQDCIFSHWSFWCIGWGLQIDSRWVSGTFLLWTFWLISMNCVLLIIISKKTRR